MTWNLILTGQKLMFSTNYMLFLFGLFCIFLFTLLNKYMYEIKANEFLFLGLFDSFVAISLFLFKSPATRYEFLFLGLSIIPLMKLYQSFCNIKYINIIKIVIRITAISTIIIFLLDCFSIFSINQSDIIIYIVIFIGILLGSILSVNIFREKNITYIFSFANFILIFSIILGVFIENIELIILSMLIFSVLGTISLMDHFVKEYKDKILEYMREKLVYKDILTSMKNRQSFERQLKEDDKKIDSFISYWAISIDLSDIKYINNNFGYSHGDKLIKNLADSIESSFSDIGNCFRISGDEFVVLIKNESKEKVERYIELFQSVISSYNNIHDIKLITSIGYDYYKSGHDKSLFDLVNRTDYMMCKNKKNFKTSWLSSFEDEQ